MTARAGPDSCERAGLYDAVILDVMLPGMDGFELVHELRREGNAVPVLMLTARTTTTDKVEGLDAGADDYMTKPFEAPELLARLRALTRRQGEVVLDEAHFADLTLDLTTHDLSCGDKSVHLSGKEFEVMQMLMSSTSRVVSKQDLLTRVWGTDGEASENSVEAYVSFLRKKLTHLKSEGADHHAAHAGLPPRGVRPRLGHAGGRHMLKRLRRKFIVIVMVLVGLVPARLARLSQLLLRLLQTQRELIVSGLPSDILEGGISDSAPASATAPPKRDDAGATDNMIGLPVTTSPRTASS